MSGCIAGVSQTSNITYCDYAYWDEHRTVFMTTVVFLVQIFSIEVRLSTVECVGLGHELTLGIIFSTKQSKRLFFLTVTHLCVRVLCVCDNMCNPVCWQFLI